MDMEQVRSAASNPIWFDEETSRLIHSLPLPKSPLRAGFLTLKSWARLAESTIVDTKRAKYTLVEDRFERELYEFHGFMCDLSPESHMACFLHAIDFLVPDGTPVYASQDGVIHEVVENYKSWGIEERHQKYMNYLTINHGQGEFSQYCHLGQWSVTRQGLKIGHKVRQGQRIGTVRKTGWTDRDHLHYLVFRGDSDRRNPFGFKSLRPRFNCE